MSNKFIYAINFEYALMEFYKNLSLSEKDVAVIFMIKHLIEQKNNLITADLLAIKMNLPTNEIDNILVSLMNRGFLEYKQGPKSLTTSLQPLEEKLSEMVQIESNKDNSKKFNEDAMNATQNIYQVFEKELGRTLSPVELSLIEEWVSNGVSVEMCVDALHEALAKGSSSLKSVDKIILKWQTRDDIEQEGHSAINGTWKKNINKTIDIAQKKWGEKK